MLAFSKFLMNRFNPFTPECLKKTLPFLSTDANRGFNLKSKRMENCVDPDETALIWIYTVCTGTGFGLPD